MIYIKYIVLTIVQFIITWVSYVLAPFVTLFADKYANLPSWLYAFQTYDNTLDGDEGWIKEHRPFKIEDNKFKRWVNHTTWLWRNPAYGFDMFFGADCKVDDFLATEGDRRTSDGPYHPGIHKWKVYRGDKLIAFQWYYVGDFNKTHCLRVNLGWKLWQVEGVALKGRVLEDTTCQLVFTPGIKKKR
jgi:hypothetical protein